MAKTVKLKDRNDNEILPLTRSTHIEMNDGTSLQIAYEGINATHYTKEEINNAGYISSYIETDPTVPSYVKGITQTDITYWNNKSELFTINFVYNGTSIVSCDKTFVQIKAAYEAGQILQAVINNGFAIGYLTQVTSSSITFNVVDTQSYDRIVSYELSVYDDDTYAILISDINPSDFITDETDPTVPSYVKNITESDIAFWNERAYINGDITEVFNAKKIYAADEVQVTANGGNPIQGAIIFSYDSAGNPRIRRVGAQVKEWNFPSYAGTIALMSNIPDVSTKQDKPLYVTLTYANDAWSADKTTAEISQALNNNTDVIAYVISFNTNTGTYLYHYSDNAASNSYAFVNICNDTSTIAVIADNFVGVDECQLLNEDNVKTINDQSIIGHGNINIDVTDLDYTVLNPDDDWNSYMYLNLTPCVSMAPASNITIDPYKVYDLGTVSQSVTIAFNTSKEASGYTKEYNIRFIAGSGCNIILPNGVLYANGTTPTYATGHTYEINVVNGCAVVGEFYTLS